MRQYVFIFIVCIATVMSNASAQTARHGEARENASGEDAIWDHRVSEWVEIETFWQRYAESKGGLTWGVKDGYPPYKKVKEGDTILIELREGPCLMEFFHSRWRRANDVRRWDEVFNHYGGCPYVFD